MLARSESPQGELMRCAKRIVRSNQAVVDPHPGFPMRSFERQHNCAALPVGGQLDVTLIPRDAEVMPRRLCNERNFDIPGVGECAVVIAQVPMSVIQRK